VHTGFVDDLDAPPDGIQAIIKPLAQIVASGKVGMVKDTNGEKIEDLSIMTIICR
jgi:hypothetical protein